MLHLMNSSGFPADINLLIASGNPFAIWVDSRNILHIATSETPFTIVPAWAKLSQAITIPNTDEAPAYSIAPESTSTDRAQYLTSVSAIIERLKHDGGKTVISRTTCGSSHGIDWGKVSQRYFERYPGTFRYLYHSPQTACWLGASPELLYRGNLNNVETMALAGTRRPTDEPWDSKNTEEHAIVTEFIARKLSDAGLTVNISSTETLNYGVIQHLLTRISGKGRYPGHAHVLDRLSPTPALAGYPLDKARLDIETAERHDRRCYSGYVAVNDGDRMEAYVNLRCVNFDKDRWCIYTGGGITAKSSPDDEWRESEIKASVLKQIIESSASAK